MQGFLFFHFVGATIGRPRAFNERPYGVKSVPFVKTLPSYLLLGKSMV